MKKFFWFLPFFFFLCGYALIYLLIPMQVFETPVLIGLSIKDAIVQLSDKQLNARILAQKEDPDIAPGTVLSQIPRPGQKIKQNQPVFLVLSCEQKKPEAPDLISKTVDYARDVLRNESIRLKYFELPSQEPVGQVIGQWPRPGVLLNEPVMIAYVSAGEKGTFVIFPNLVDKPVPEVQDFLQQHGIAMDISYASARDQQIPYNQCKVKTQKPLAGSLVDVGKQQTVRLNIERL